MFTNLFTPFIIIFLSFLSGLLIGSLITFFKMLENNKRLEKEIDIKTKQLQR